MWVADILMNSTRVMFRKKKKFNCKIFFLNIRNAFLELIADCESLATRTTGPRRIHVMPSFSASEYFRTELSRLVTFSE